MRQVCKFLYSVPRSATAGPYSVSTSALHIMTICFQQSPGYKMVSHCGPNLHVSVINLIRLLTIVKCLLVSFVNFSTGFFLIDL